jgi:hypothetical protein
MLHVEEHWKPVFAQLNLGTCAAVSSYFSDPSGASKGVEVTQRLVTTPNGTADVFFKRYAYEPASWKFLWRASKARREAENYGILTRLGIRVAELIAWGEERDAVGRLRFAFIITRAILQATTLLEFHETLKTMEPSRAKRHRALILEELAGMTRKIHEAGFFHHDLVWRNILVSSTPEGELRLYWIDCPRGAYDTWSPLRGRKRLRDLAGLDKSAVRYWRRVERARFLHLYLGKPKLAEAHKRLARAVVKYRIEH